MKPPKKLPEPQITDLRQTMADEQIVNAMQADFDRRRAKIRGRVLLWMLRKWT